MSKLTDLLSGVRDAKGEFDLLKKDIERLKRRREDLHALPVPRKELADAYCRWIDERAKIFPGKVAASLSFFVKHPLALAGSVAGEFTQSSVGGQKANSFVFATDRPDMTGISEAGILYIDLDQAKKRFRHAIEVDMDYPDEVGPPMAERLAEIKRLDAKIMELEAEAESAEQALRSIGAIS